MEFNLMIEIVERIVENPLLLLFVLVWFVGWFVKYKTEMNNKLIPLIVLAASVVLGLIIIEFSLNGFFIGVLVGTFEIGFYEFIKETGKLAKKTRKGEDNE